MEFLRFLARKKLPSCSNTWRRSPAVTDEQKIGALQKERSATSAEIAKYEKFAHEGGELTALGVEQLLSLKEKQSELEKLIATLTEKKFKDEKSIYELALKQLAVQQEMDQLAGKRSLVSEDQLIVNGKAYGASRDTRVFQAASTAELQELIRRTQNEINTVEQSKGHGPGALVDAVSGFIIQGSVIDRLKTDILRAQYELNQRNSVRQDDMFGGPDAARRRFQGDPLSFDRFYQQFADQQSEQQKQTAALTDIKDTLRKGIRTVPIGG